MLLTLHGSCPKSWGLEDVYIGSTITIYLHCIVLHWIYIFDVFSLYLFTCIVFFPYIYYVFSCFLLILHHRIVSGVGVSYHFGTFLLMGVCANRILYLFCFLLFIVSQWYLQSTSGPQFLLLLCLFNKDLSTSATYSG